MWGNNTNLNLEKYQNGELTKHFPLCHSSRTETGLSEL